MENDSFFENLKEYFLFKSIEKIEGKDFFFEWQNIDRKERKMFNFYP